MDTETSLVTPMDDKIDEEGTSDDVFSEDEHVLNEEFGLSESFKPFPAQKELGND